MVRFHYGAADEKFVTSEYRQRNPRTPVLDTYKFKLHPFLKGRSGFNRNDVPIVFKASPLTLLELCSRVVDALPMPPVHTWNTDQVCKWVREYGYPQYQNTFRVNMINGRTLVLIDAAALSAMNIKKFDHIKHLTYGIRLLFGYELTKFSRSISLPPDYYYELYLLYRVKNGEKYEMTRRTELWRQMQLVRELPKNLSHWELLERWLALEPLFTTWELFGAARRRNLYRCKPAPLEAPAEIRRYAPCDCMPPCECHWKEEHYRAPWRLSCLGKTETSPKYKTECARCLPPPCTCGWTPKQYLTNHVLTVLRSNIPAKYGDLRRYSSENFHSYQYSARFSIV